MCEDKVPIMFWEYDPYTDHLTGWCTRCGGFVDNGEAVCCPVCGVAFSHMISLMPSGK